MYYFSQFHLANQYYNICIRRSRGYCSICYSPQLLHAGAAITATSFGVGAASPAAPTISVNQGQGCTGVTTSHATDASAVGLGKFSLNTYFIFLE